MDRSALRSVGASRTGPGANAGVRRWYGDAIWNLLVIVSGFAIYSFSYALYRWLYPGAAWKQHALQNAQRIVGLEQALGILGERRLQALFLGHDFALRAINSAYLWFHIPLIAVFAVWLYVRDRRRFRLTRNAFLIAGAIALICELWPVAPPYLLGGLHIIDTSATSAGGHVAEPRMFFNYYGAVPSIHVGWAFLMGLAVWRSARSRTLRALALAWPLVMAVAVVASGNHYFFDVITGVLTALAGLWLGNVLLTWWESHQIRLAPNPAAARIRGERQ